MGYDRIPPSPPALRPAPQRPDCDYCGGLAPADSAGRCGGCGAPRLAQATSAGLLATPTAGQVVTA